MTQHTFPDGSSIDWVDRETLRYSKGEYSALVWCDFGEGFFSSERIIRTDSLLNWEKAPQGESPMISSVWKQTILSRVANYYDSHGKKYKFES
jgi:hypothetical protein